MSTDISDWVEKVDMPNCPNPIIEGIVVDILRRFCEYTKIWEKRLSPINIVVVEAATDIAFVASDPDTITSTSTSFTSAGLAAGMTIVTDHVTSEEDEKDNTGPYLLGTVAALLLTLDSNESVVADDAGDSIYISVPEYEISSSDGDIISIANAKFDGKKLIPKTENWLDSNVSKWRTEMSTQPVYYCMGPSRKMWLVRAPQEEIENGLEVWVYLKPLLTATSVEDFFYDDYEEVISDGAKAKLYSMIGKPWANLELSNYFAARYIIGRNQAWNKSFKRYTRATFGIRA